MKRLGLGLEFWFYTYISCSMIFHSVFFPGGIVGFLVGLFLPLLFVLVSAALAALNLDKTLIVFGVFWLLVGLAYIVGTIFSIAYLYIYWG